MADFLWRWYVPPEQQTAREVYRSIYDKLKQVPEQPAGAPFPPTVSVEEQVRILNQERVALLASQPPLSTPMLRRSR